LLLCQRWPRSTRSLTNALSLLLSLSSLSLFSLHLARTGRTRRSLVVCLLLREQFTVNSMNLFNFLVRSLRHWRWTTRNSNHSAASSSLDLHIKIAVDACSLGTLFLPASSALCEFGPLFKVFTGSRLFWCIPFLSCLLLRYEPWTVFCFRVHNLLNFARFIRKLLSFVSFAFAVLRSSSV
jgi:hypothetical protein